MPSWWWARVRPGSGLATVSTVPGVCRRSPERPAAALLSSDGSSRLRATMGPSLLVVVLLPPAWMFHVKHAASVRVPERMGFRVCSRPSNATRSAVRAVAFSLTGWLLGPGFPGLFHVEHPLRCRCRPVWQGRCVAGRVPAMLRLAAGGPEWRKRGGQRLRSGAPRAGGRVSRETADGLPGVLATRRVRLVGEPGSGRSYPADVPRETLPRFGPAGGVECGRTYVRNCFT